MQDNKSTPTPGIPQPKDEQTVILNAAGLNGVCTDEHLYVIKSFGDTNTFLKNEHFIFDLPALLPPGLSLSIKAASYQAIKSGLPVALNGLNFEDNGVPVEHTVNMVISPFTPVNSTDRNLLFLFTMNNDKQQDIGYTSPESLKQINSQHLINLEQELTDVKKNLETAYGIISTSNKNIQSFNQELQSSNEEMHSANEELQSVNEELHALNKQQQQTNTELSESNDDLNNYFRSNTNGQLFVDRNLLLKRYSPGTTKHLNLRERDIGQPLTHITTNIKFQTVIADIRQVMLDGKTITREAESADGTYYQVMTVPYLKKNSNKAEGAIISFYDITELKNLLKERDIHNTSLNSSNRTIDDSNKSLLRINADLNTFVFGASHDLNAPIVNLEMLLQILNDKLNSTDPEIIELTGMMTQAITNFKAIIRDLASVGSIDSEDKQVNKERFTELFTEIENTLSEKIKAAKAIFHTDFQIEEVRFAKKNLRSVLLNLITNALKYSDPNRRLEVSIGTQIEGQFIVLSITDNGIGISTEQIEHIFKKYKRVNTTTEGTGVGLYLIRKIVNASGGKIEVQCVPGGGCSFRVFFKR